MTAYIDILTQDIDISKFIQLSFLPYNFGNKDLNILEKVVLWFTNNQYAENQDSIWFGCIER